MITLIFMYSLILTSSSILHSVFVKKLLLLSILLSNKNMFTFLFAIDVLSGYLIAISAVRIIISKFTYYVKTPLPCLLSSFQSPS